MPDGLYKVRTDGRGDFLCRLLPLFPVSDIDLDLDEFMMGDGVFDFFDNGIGKPVSADENDGLEGMGEGFEMLLLFGAN